MPSPFSKSQLTKLGKRLRNADPPDPEDLEQLHAFVSAHQSALREVAGGLQQVGFEPTTRLKTTASLIEKLKRQPGTRLPQIQDIAGARIVVAETLTGQDRIADAIAQVWPGARRSDRRRDPSSGYRALHLIVTEQEMLVEVQLRTQWQDLWAQTFERVADLLGRQIRYGGTPDEPTRPVLSGSVSRAQLVEILLDVSVQVAGLELVEDRGDPDAPAQEVANVKEALRRGLPRIIDLLDER